MANVWFIDVKTLYIAPLNPVHWIGGRARTWGRCCWSVCGCRLGGPVVFHRHGAGWSLGTPSPWGPRCQTAPGAAHTCDNYTHKYSMFAMWVLWGPLLTAFILLHPNPDLQLILYLTFCIKYWVFVYYNITSTVFYSSISKIKLRILNMKVVQEL